MCGRLGPCKRSNCHSWLAAPSISPSAAGRIKTSQYAQQLHRRRRGNARYVLTASQPRSSLRRGLIWPKPSGDRTINTWSCELHLSGRGEVPAKSCCTYFTVLTLYFKICIFFFFCALLCSIPLINPLKHNVHYPNSTIQVYRELLPLTTRGQ